MSFISWSVPNLINGVSQQPATLRHRSQAEAVKNAYSSVVEGIGKRYPTEHVAKLTGATSPAYLHTINRDSSERYEVVVEDGDLRVFDMVGTAKTVNFPDGKDYLDAADPTTAFSLLTIADYTFVVNRGETVAITADKTEDRRTEALVSVKQGAYSSDYEIWVDGTKVGDNTTPDNSTSANALQIQTNYVAEQLETDLDANLPNAPAWAGTTAYALDDVVTLGSNIYQCVTAGTSASSGGPTGTGSAIADDTVVWDYVAADPLWRVERQGSSLQLYRVDKADFEIKVVDSHAGTDLKLAKDTVQRFTDLPVVAPRDFTVEVIGDASNAFDNYFVKFQPTNETADFDTGDWIESVAPGIDSTLDGTTMPHLLIRESDGTFTFRVATEWETRGAGDTESNVMPSFVGHPIESLFLWKERLSVVWRHGIVQSEASEFFSFFRKTVTTKLATDRIDIGANHTKVANLKFAVPFDEQVIVFSDSTQFAYHSNGEALSVETVEMEPTTEFEMGGTAAPVHSGTRVYFPQAIGAFSGIREYLVEKISRTKDAAEITAHAPKYIEGSVTHLAAAPTYKMLVVGSDAEQNVIYPYFYYWDGEGKKLQSSWSKWEFDITATILDIEFLDNYLYLAIEYAGDGVYLERMRVDAGWADDNQAFVTMLDRRVTEADCTLAYDAGTDETTITLPYTPTGTLRVVSRNTGGATLVGQVLPVLSTSGTDINVQGDHTSTPFFVGQQYSFEYTFSEQTIKEGDKGTGAVAIGTSRTQVLRMYLRYANTSSFRVEVTPLYRDTTTTVFTGRILDAGSNTLDAIPSAAGTHKVGIRSRTDRVLVKIVNEEHLPCWFQGADFEGEFTNRSRRR